MLFERISLKNRKIQILAQQRVQEGGFHHTENTQFMILHEFIKL